MSSRTADYDYPLPEHLIAMYPAQRRERSRLMVVDRNTEQISHHHFTDITNLILPDELVVLNNTRVIPARIRLENRNAEILLLRPLNLVMWRCLVRPGKWFSIGREFVTHGLSAEVVQIYENGERSIRFDRAVDFEKVGELPLPPYIKRAVEPLDRERYQTVFASRPGAIAAPTAGLHFSPDLLRHIPHEFITLHIGVGTFQPVKAKRLSAHRMHREEFEVTAEAATRLNEARRVLAVGTTTVRTLESLMYKHGRILAGSDSTDIFIFPPFRFRRVNSLLTNFHLPRSTLLMLVAAFAGRELILEAYRQAIAEQYRFFSYGDCMLIR
ncbi:MAG: tRNA preQ1(34) S-adenosylmethionine ribosyltransferase-isomerase QueA [Chthoniobacterales bacterium]